MSAAALSAAVGCGTFAFATASTVAASTPPPPVLGQSANVSPVSGTVTVTPPGGRATALAGPEQIPVGSVVNASKGAVELQAADTGSNPPYSGQFSKGEFEVKQSVNGDGTTQIVLEGVCTKASAASDVPQATAARRAHHHILRFLQINANGKFEIVAVNGTATESGAASWVVNDKCNGTTSVVDRSGQIEQASRSGHIVQLAPGESGELYCRPLTGPLKYCEAVVSEPDDNYGHFELDIYHRHEQRFTMCLLHKLRTARCLVGTFKPDAHGSEGTFLLCYLNTLPRGAYETRFVVSGKQVGILLPYTTSHAPVLIGPSGSYCRSFFL